MKRFPVILPLLALLILSTHSMAKEPIGISSGVVNTVAAEDGIDPESFGKALNDKIWQQLKQTKSHADFTVKINPNLPEFHFSLHGNYSSGVFKPSHLECREASTTELNHINLKNVMHSKDVVEGKLFNIVEFIDINFDGYLDLRVFDNAGPTGDWWQTFLYDSTNRKFVYNKDISELPTLAVDSRNKRLYSCRKAGPCREDVARYTMNNDMLHLEKIVWTVPGFLNYERKLVISGKEFDKLQKQQKVVSYCVRTVAVPGTKSAHLSFKNIVAPKVTSGKFKVVALSYENAFDLIMKDMPNDEIKKRLWFYRSDELYYDIQN